MSRKPTEEQLLIINSIGNVAVNAKPGSGKTFTIVEKISKVLETLPDHKGIIAISYTNKASNEILDRFKKKKISIKNSFFGTMHKFYISDIIIPFSSYLTGKKMEPIFVDKESISEYYSCLKNLDLKPDSEMESILLSALNEGYIILDKVGEYANYILDHVDKASKYLTARYSAIFIDEYQDCGEAQHEMFLKLISLGLNGIAVGDLNQAIYGYENKESKYLSELLEKDSFSRFDLSKNFRCHKSIADYSLALYLDPHIESEVKDTRVFKINITGDETEIARKIDHYLPYIIRKYSQGKTIKNNQVAILARYRRTCEIIDSSLITPHKYFKPTPLDSSAYECDRIFKELLFICLSNSTSVINFVESYFYDDVEVKKANKLFKLVSCLKQIDNPMEELINHLDLFEKIARLILLDNKKIKMDKLKNVLENKECLDSFVEASDDQVNIITMHSAKGLEFDIVFHLNLNDYELPNLESIKNGHDSNSYKQDINLHYVTITRAIEVCYLITNTQRTNASKLLKTSSQSSFFSVNSSLKNMRKEFKW